MISLFLVCVLFRVSVALYSDYFPPPVEGVTVLKSKHDDGVTLLYKKTDVCECSYSGFVQLPASNLSDVEGPPEYQINMFYWFFPARESPETAPLTIWIGGGPGESAISGAMLENGPCYVSEDGNSTTTNPFSLNNRVNTLYVDQPVGAGYSYSNLVNVTYDQISQKAVPTDFSRGLPFKPNATVIPGTVGDSNLAFTANNSDIAAKAMWHFAQTWFDTFPIYHPENDKISLWTNSYGGYFGSAIFRFWEEQNKKIQSGALQAHYLRLDTLGIENGCIDAVSQATSWPQIAYNNTYNFPLINKTTYDEFIHNITKPDDGCIAIIQKCRDVAAVGDPQFTANNKTVNDCFAPAAEQCLSGLQIASTYANRANFDIAQIAPGSFPGYQHVAFFNQRWVQRSLGVPLNYTDNIQIGINDLYFAIDGDAFRQNQTSIEYLLKNDIQVALVYGDRDTRCNWIGVENVSLTVDYPGAHNFRSAGYANLQTNKSYTGGVVRQYDGFSFSRVFEAGHQVSSFQPETVSQIFDRVMFRRDIATGKVAAGFEQDPSVKGFSSRLSGFIGWGLQQAKSVSHYQSKGPSSSWSIKHKLPPSPPVVCNLWAVGATCTENQIAALSNGTAVIDGCYITSPAS